MKKVLGSLLVVLLFLSPTLTQAQAQNQLLVYFSSGVKQDAANKKMAEVTSPDLSAMFAAYGIGVSDISPAFPDFKEADTIDLKLGESSRQVNWAKIFTISVNNPSTKAALLGMLKKLPNVLYAEEDGVSSVSIIPADGRFGLQWNMRNTIVPGADIHAEQAWDIYTGNPNAIIAVIDAGVDINHNDLNTKILGGDAGFATSLDIFGRLLSHGSHVAGIAAAITNNAGNNGVAGVDWQARIHPRQVIVPGSGDANVSNAIIGSVNFSPNVWTLNHSWSTRNPDGTEGRYSTTLRSAFAHAYKNNRVACAAMGNHHVGAPEANDVIAYPAGFNTGLIAVGATDFTDAVAGFSGRGQHIDVSAPGDGVVSTNFNNEYIDESGTSMATPHVSGLASLLKGFNTALSNDDIEQIIRLSADDRGDPGFDNQFGTGRINAQRALQFLQAPNNLQQLSATGGTVVNTSRSVNRVFLGVPGFPDATYVVKRSEIRKDISLPTGICTIAGVWGRGVGTTGYREEFDRCYGEGICEVVPGTLTNTGCTLRTWVYQVWNALGQYLGYYPASPANAVFQYTVLSVPAPSAIAGDGVICNTPQNYSVAGIPPNMNVNWSVVPPGIVNPSCTVCPQTTLSRLTDGNITLTANIPGCISNPTFFKNIRVGGYSQSSPFNTSGPHVWCVNQVSSVYVDQNVYTGLSNFVWGPTPTGWITVTGGTAGSSYIVLRATGSTSPPSGTITVSATDVCGNTITVGHFMAKTNCFTFKISPNPANNQVTVDVLDEATGKMVEEPVIKAVEITDKMGQVYYSEQFSNRKSRGRLIIPVNLLKNDAYIIRIFDGLEWHPYKLIVQH